MDPQTNPLDSDNVKGIKTGFQAKYLNPYYRRLFLDRKIPPINDKGPPEKPKVDEFSDKNSSTQNLDEMVKMVDKPLLQIKTVFPFTLFPTKIILDIHKISIVYKHFFASEQIHSVLIRDVSDVVLETSLFFATLKIIDIGYTDNTIDIAYLKKSDGNLARRVIQGLTMAHKNNVDLTKVERQNLVGKLESLGTNEHGKIL